MLSVVSTELFVGHNTGTKADSQAFATMMYAFSVAKCS